MVAAVIYAGIGAREITAQIDSRIATLGRYCAMRGFMLRSGGADGSDKAFERGCDSVPGGKQIFTPYDAINHPDWFGHAAKYHPAWGSCKYDARLKHARNSAIILGADLRAPVNFVVCWTRNGQAIGGTGQGLRIADALNIPIFNLFYPDAYTRLLAFTGGA
jgi:hypothetical protein